VSALRLARRAGAIVVLAIATAAIAAPTANKELAALFEREFKWALDEHPEFATFLGIDGYGDRLTDYSPQSVRRRREHLATVAADLRRFDPKDLSTQDRISRDVMLDEVLLSQREDAMYGDLPFSSGDGWARVTSMNGPQDNLAGLARATRFRRVADYEDYLKRLALIPKSIEQQQAMLEAGIRSGWVPPRAAMERVPGMLAVFAGADIAASPEWRPFENFPGDIPAADRERLAAAGKRVLSEQVHPAFARLKRFIEEKYLPACSRSLAASSLPAGPAYYALRVNRMTTTTLTPAEIHETGKREVARIRAAMNEVIASTGFKGTFPEFLEFLKIDPRFFFKTPESRLMAYRDIGKRADAELPKLFATLPRLPYGIRAMEAYEGDNSDHYSPGAIDGSRAGFFEANVNNLEKRPSHEMESTLLHETVPGHHLQIARAQEIEGLPVFRRTGWYVAYGEGWALYAESLGYEMGLYKDPYSRFGALAGEMLRACRLVIDTGLHSFNWTRDQSIRYLAENAGVHQDYATAEIDRYIVWPGQALGYKIGELKIKALRAKAKDALGDKFDLRRFHNAVLDDGALPLTVLEARIDEWIASERAAKR